MHPKRLLESLVGGGWARAEADVAAFAAGEAREVAAFARQADTFVQGLLLLDPAVDPLVWRPFARIPGRPAQRVVLSAPFRVHGAGPVSGPGSWKVSAQFHLISFQAGDQNWEIAVPALDVPLVRAAMTRAGSQS